MHIDIQRASVSRVNQIPNGDLGFGRIFSDHMFSMDWLGDGWIEPRIHAYGPIEVIPSALALHYGQSVFEGLKAYRGPTDDRIRLFRPHSNAQRLRDSCERLCIPCVSPDIFLEAICELVSIDCEWVPQGPDCSLYIRPLLFGSEGTLAVRAASTYRFLIITAPVQEYFDRQGQGIYLKAEHRFTRASPGGTGGAKTAANYAATLRPMSDSAGAGFDQILWLDGVEHRYVEEAGQMNIFFHLGDTIVTPDLSGTILPGITRDTALTILREWGYKIEERRISMDEVITASKAGTLREAFGAGTAAVVVPIDRIHYLGQDLQLPQGGNHSLCQQLYQTITELQFGVTQDNHGWSVLVD